LAFEKLPPLGSSVKFYVAEAVSGMYAGVINLYGFLTREEREMYLLIKDEVPGSGAKKAVEYIDKISKSPADFKSAVISKNSLMLHEIFGFTKKTADKLIASLKDKIALVNVSGDEKWKISSGDMSLGILSEAVSALMALGYKDSFARNAVNKAYEINKDATLEELIKQSLKYL
jgi:Holliday junction DNA helicase RuvA